MQPKKYQNKYLVQSNRLLDWDYSANGGYFITICVQDKKECLGEILIDDNHEPSVALSAIGNIARDCWLEIPKYHPYVILDEFIIMPNHIHGIIQINKNAVETRHIASIESETPCMASLQGDGYKNQFGPQSKNLASIIRGYKSAVTMYARKNNIDFAWQPSFYDHIIRTEKTLQKIREYIKYNPLKWKWDRNNPENL